MDNDELTNDLKDLLVRVEGTINVLRKPNVIRADQKLQGVRDKLRHMLFKATRKPATDEAGQIALQIRQLALDKV